MREVDFAKQKTEGETLPKALYINGFSQNRSLPQGL